VLAALQQPTFSPLILFSKAEPSGAISTIVTIIKKEIEKNEAGEGKARVSDLVIRLCCFTILRMKNRNRRELEIKMRLEWDTVVDDIAGEASRNENRGVVARGKTPGDQTGGLPPALMFQGFPE